MTNYYTIQNIIDKTLIYIKTDKSCVYNTIRNNCFYISTKGLLNVLMNNILIGENNSSNKVFIGRDLHEKFLTKKEFEKLKRRLINEVKRLESACEYDNKCKQKLHDWSIKMINRMPKNKVPFYFPEFIIENQPITNAIDFYNRDFIRLRTNQELYMKITSIFELMNVCAISDSVDVGYKDGKINVYNLNKLYDIYDCINIPEYRYIFVPVSLIFKQSRHAVACIIDKEKRVVLSFDPHGSEIEYQYNYIMINDFGELLADMLQYKFQPLEESCNIIGIQILENKFKDKFYKDTEQFFKTFIPQQSPRYDQGIENNCVLWTIIMIIAKISNPQIDDDVLIQKRLLNWLSQNRNSINVIKRLVVILKIGKVY